MKRSAWPFGRRERALEARGGTLFKANVREAVSSLAAMGIRSVLALVGIAVGIGAVIAMVSIGEIVKEEALEQFRALGTDVVTVRRKRGDAPSGLSRADVAGLADAIPPVAAAAPWTSDSAEVAYAGATISQGQLLGVTEAFAPLHRLAIAEGRFVSDLDADQPFCVLGDTMAQLVREAGGRQLVGERVRIEGRLFTVVGVVGPNPRSAQSPGTDDAVLLPIGATARMGNRIDRAIVRVRSGADAFDAARQVTAYFRRVAPGLDLEVVSARELIEQMQRQARMFTLLFGAVGSISLVVGGIGVMNVMLMSVAERRAEIGVRRALGARRRDIIAQFVTESAALCVVGGIAGILLGAAGAWVISRFSGWSFFLSLPAVWVGVAVSTGVGIFFGLYPARQAAQLDPIAALRA